MCLDGGFGPGLGHPRRARGPTQEAAQLAAALMDRVRARAKDRRVLALVKAFLKAGVPTKTRRHEDNFTGTPQGGILSPRY